MAKIVVESGRLDDVHRWIDPEDGEVRTCLVWNHRVSFRTAHGMEYTLLHAFDDTPAGAAQAARIAAKVRAKIDAEGIEGLDEACWNTRVIYGTQAYLDDEPYIVQREKEDALSGY